MFISCFCVYRPLTPPYVPFGIRRFRALTPQTRCVFRCLLPSTAEHRFCLSFDSVILSTDSLLAEHLTNKAVVTFNYWDTARFGPSVLCETSCLAEFFFGRLVARHTMTSADFSRQALLRVSTSTVRHVGLYTSVRPPQLRAYSFHLISAWFTPVRSG